MENKRGEYSRTSVSRNRKLRVIRCLYQFKVICFGLEQVNIVTYAIDLASHLVPLSFSCQIIVKRCDLLEADTEVKNDFVSDKMF